MSENFEHHRDEDPEVETLALIANGFITTRDILDARAQFGLLPSEITDEDATGEKKTVEEDFTRRKVEEAFSDMSAAANILGDAVHWGPREIESLAERLRLELLETVIADPDPELEAWARDATPLEVIGFCYKWATWYNDADEV